MKPLHDIRTAAKLLCISTWSVRAYIRQQKLHPVRIGRRVLLEEAELERFVAEAKVGDEFLHDQQEEENDNGRQTE